jgi:hypothetical protein
VSISHHSCPCRAAGDVRVVFRALVEAGSTHRAKAQTVASRTRSARWVAFVVCDGAEIQPTEPARAPLARHPSVSRRSSSKPNSVARSSRPASSARPTPRPRAASCTKNLLTSPRRRHEVPQPTTADRVSRRTRLRETARAAACVRPAASRLSSAPRHSCRPCSLVRPIRHRDAIRRYSEVGKSSRDSVH